MKNITLINDKVMTQEEKAKRYDEALKLAKDSYNYPSYPGFIRADVVFPEFKESDDERIRKWLISQLKIKSDGTDSDLNIMIDKAIAWLEKQGEQKTTWKPTEEQIKTFEHFVRSIGESGYASPYENNTKLLYSLLEQLKKL